jgi:hypothetical protein
MVSSGGSIVESAALLNGQLLIGSTGLAPAVGNITGSGGAVVTNGAGTIAISTNAVSTNTASTIVTRDASGDFSAAAITNNSNILKGSTSGTVTMKAPATVTSYTLTWPTAVGGAGNFLMTDASGNLSWGPPGGVGDSSYAAKGIVQFLTDAATSGITVSSGVANVNSGTGANQIVKLDGTAKLPPVDGSALTTLNAGNISSGTLPVTRGGTGSTSFTADRILASNGTGSALVPFNCAVGEYLSFGAAGLATCGSATSGSAFVNGGNTFAAAATLGTNDAYALNFETNNIARMTLLSDGKLGIGVTSPGALVDINGTYEAMGSTQGMLAVSSTTAFGIDKGGSISLGGKVDGTSTLKTYGMITGMKENATSGNEAGYMAFGTRTNGGLPTERMRISSAGLVGIGNTNPEAKLHINSSDANTSYPFTQTQNNIILQNTNSTTNNWSGIGFHSSGSNISGGIAFQNTSHTNHQGDLAFFTRGPVAGLTEKLRVMGDGNVGINTTAPGEKLEVNGNVKATNFISTSDARLKTEIHPIDGLSAILRLQGVHYRWKNTGEGDAGVLAQEVEKVFPDAVRTDSQTGYKGVKYQYLIAPLIEASKELHGLCQMQKTQLEKIQRDLASVQGSDQRQNQRIELLELENQKVKKENAALKKRLELIEQKLGL